MKQFKDKKQSNNFVLFCPSFFPLKIKKKPTELKKQEKRREKKKRSERGEMLFQKYDR